MDNPIYVNSVDNFMTTSPQITNVKVNDIDIQGRPYLLKIKYVDAYYGKEEIKEKEIIVMSNSPGEAIVAFSRMNLGSIPRWEIFSIEVVLPDLILDLNKRISF